MGSGTPWLIIYVDGQTLVREKGSNHWYQETKLSSEEMCKLRLRVQKTGFFDLKIPSVEFFYTSDNPIYTLDDFSQVGDGAFVEIIQVNGDLQQTVNIYTPLLDYLSPTVRNTRLIVSTYWPSPTKRYDPRWALLWIQKGRGEAPNPACKPVVWPSDLPKLADLWSRRFLEYNFGGDAVLLEGKLLQQMMELFHYHTTGRLFIEENQEYYLILRPILPHETVHNIAPYAQADQRVKLPFKCK